MTRLEKMLDWRTRLMAIRDEMEGDPDYNASGLHDEINDLTDEISVERDEDFVSFREGPR